MIKKQQLVFLGRWIAPSFYVALAYAATGALCLQLAIPPGFAASIWAPSGVALAAVLVYGNRVWLGILLGSFFVNVWNDFDTSTASSLFVGLTVLLSIGAGAALQALVGAFCVRRFAGYPNDLGNEREVFSFLAFGGPLSCLVSATVGVASLFAAGKIPEQSLLINFSTWWIGDVMGVFVFAPIILSWTARPRETWASRRLIVTLPMLFAFVATVAAVGFGSHWEKQELKLKFDRQAESFVTALNSHLNKYIDVLHSQSAFYAASPFLDQHHFKIFTEWMLADHPGLQALSWNPRILESERVDFETRVQRETSTNFQITERNGDGELVRSAEYPEYVVVQFIEPFKNNQQAFGYNVASNPTRREALKIARDSGDPIATARITLVQEAGRQFGVLVFMPVYLKERSRDTLEQRGRNLAGYMVGVLRGGDIVESALRDVNRDGVVYSLVDESAPNEEQFLMEDARQGQEIFTLEESGLFGGSTPIGKIFPIEFAGRKWKFKVAPTQKYLALHRQEYSWLILVAGMLLTSLVGAFVLVVSGRRCELELAHKKLTALALYDQLTGLPNRNAFQETLERTLKLANRRQEGFSVLMLDLDRFKNINDTLGHHAGDEALRLVSKRLRTVLRETDLCARLGGDEFGIILISNKTAAGAETVAKKITQAMEKPFIIQGQVFTMGCSIGIALYPEDGMDSVSLVRKSDAAMYLRKQKGFSLNQVGGFDQRTVAR